MPLSLWMKTLKKPWAKCLLHTNLCEWPRRNTSTFQLVLLSSISNVSRNGGSHLQGKSQSVMIQLKVMQLTATGMSWAVFLPKMTRKEDPHDSKKTTTCLLPRFLWMLTKGQKWIQKPTPLEGKREKMKNDKENMDREWSCKSYGGHMCLVQPFCQRRETWMPLSISFRHFHDHLCPSMMSPAHQSLKGEAPYILPWGPSRLAQGCPELRRPHSCWPASAFQTVYSGLGIRSKWIKSSHNNWNY